MSFLNSLVSTLAETLQTSQQNSALIIGLALGLLLGKLLFSRKSKSASYLGWDMATPMSTGSINVHSISKTLSSGSVVVNSQSKTLESQDLERIHAALKSSNMIEAIKIIREVTGADLKTAKDMAEAFELSTKLKP